MHEHTSAAGEQPAVPASPRASSRPRYERPRVAVDTVVLAVEDRHLKTYLVQLKHGPLRDRWAFPGGLVRVSETLDCAARRELQAAAGLDNAYLEQLFTFGDPSRDPRSHVVSVAYMALLSDTSEAVAPSAVKYRAGRWFAMDAGLPPLAYDHTVMARYALGRLTAKLEYSNIAVALLPPHFTFKQLEDVYGALLGRAVDRRNFRRRIMAMKLLEQLPAKRRGPHRPAALYRFVSRTPQIVQML